MKKPKGFSVPELMVACFFVGLLTAFVFSSYWMGLRAVFKSQAQNELLVQLQVAARRLGEAMEQSSGLSVTILNLPAPPPHPPHEYTKAVSFLTNVDQNGRSIFYTPPDSGPEWQAYLVFIFEPPPISTFRIRRVELAPTAPQRRFPTPIEQYDDPIGGLQPLSFYAMDGEPVARLIDHFKMEPIIEVPDGYTFELRGFKPKEGNRHESRSALNGTIAVRN